MDGASADAASPTTNTTRPTTIGFHASTRSNHRPVIGIDTSWASANPENTQPYQPRPPRSSRTTGRMVDTAIASVAIAVTMATSAAANARRRRSRGTDQARFWATKSQLSRDSMKVLM
jgi:hypothetical protein